MKKITHFNVGNGSCCLVETTDFVMIVDLNKTEDKNSSYELLKPFFRKKDGKDCIDVLCITHGDEDHCLNYGKFQEEIDADNLVIGTIWHQGYDRTKVEKKKDLPEDYKILQKEIDRRMDVKNPDFGDLQIALRAGDVESEAFEGVDFPSDLTLKTISPIEGQDENSDYNHNDLSLVFNLNFDDLEGMLFTGDSSSKYWQDEIIPEYLGDNEGDAEAKYLVAAHHGSYSFFGKDRDEVREADPSPDNYEALDKIQSHELILSAEAKFPLDGDSPREDPPHYAAWKWYHKWFRENRNIKEDDKHPDCFHYTSEGNVRLEYKNKKWKWIKDWDHNEKDKKASEAKKMAAAQSAGALSIGSLKSKPTHYYGDRY
eukprot:TRINITY_DN6137_c0_g4_i1.p1 TRINITY_DN6137_c0_g4~~TRINITY_DN6137_c0_g4_i1.p1  ORF type:complete len:371 (+),score=58.71 TRINITY_DN6137_c0_g4_i1:589-1701(+)